MKPLTVKTRIRALLAGLAVCAAGMMSAQASSTIVTFSVNMTNDTSFTIGTDTVSVNGTFNGYSALPLTEMGSTGIFTNTVNDTADANGGELQYKFVVDGSTWENTASGQNRAALLPATSGASLVLPTAYFSDDGPATTNEVTFQVDISQQITLGNFTPGTSTVEVRGLFNGWTGGVSELTNNPSIMETNTYGLVTSNVWMGTFPVVGSPGGAEGFKYVINPGTVWESPSSVNSDGGGNRYFANVAQTLPLVNFSDAPFAPLCAITFNVDMSVVVLTDTNYVPGSVTLNGDFNGWSSGVVMTNNPSAANTNIYTATASVGEGGAVNYQYRYVEASTGATVYDHANGANGGQGNRYFAVPAVSATNLPAVYFNDAELDDYLTQPTAVTFSVDMANAVGYGDNHAFNPSADSVYLNGQFANWYAWAGGVNPASAPPGYQMIEEGLTTIYTNTIIIPAGTPIGFDYKYGMDINSANGGPADDEAGFGLNHFRVVRSTVGNAYTLPQDTFGNQYNEPIFSISDTVGGNLSIGAKSGGTVPVSWLGRPGARLQTAGSVLGPWTTLAATDGTNWVTGTSSTNGFVSQTNFPAAGNTYFRLIKQ